jgi:hypothetical protein
MARLELRGQPIGWVPKLVEAIHVVDGKGAIASGLKGGIDLISTEMVAFQ